MTTFRKSRQEDDDDYWTTSAASNIKSKGFNFFDESQDVESTLATAKKLMKVSAFQEDVEDDDVINWDGTPAPPPSTKITFTSTNSGVKSARYSAHTTAVPPAGLPTSSSLHEEKPRNTSLIVSSHSRNASTDSSKSTGTKSNIVLSPAMNDNSPQTIDDVVSSYSVSKKTLSLTDLSKLEAENKFLRKSLETVKEQKFTRLPPTDTIKRMITGQPYSLEIYKSHEDKCALLDTAIRYHDGNAITAAVLFFKKTVKQGIFNKALLKRPEAVSHYLQYLRQHYEYNEYTDILGMMGRTEEAAMFKYQQAIVVRQPETKIKSLNSCLSAHFQSDSSLHNETLCIQEQVALLERQLQIETSDAKDQAAGLQKFRDIPRIMYVLDTPLIDTIYYCCYHHYDLPDHALSSPWKLKKVHQVSDKQFLWTALKSRAKLKRWHDVEALFQSKHFFDQKKGLGKTGWFGATKMKAPIGFDNVVTLLYNVEAPKEILQKYLKLVDDTSKRMELANKYNCPEAVIDTYLQLKDREQLEAYMLKLKPHSQAWFYADNVLKASTIKWKK